MHCLLPRISCWLWRRSLQPIWKDSYRTQCGPRITNSLLSLLSLLTSLTLPDLKGFYVSIPKPTHRVLVVAPRWQLTSPLQSSLPSDFPRTSSLRSAPCISVKHVKWSVQSAFLLFSCFYLTSLLEGPRGMSPCFWALTVLLKDHNLAPSTSTVWLTTI